MINNLVVHCSDSPQGRGDAAVDIHRWHLEKGWDGIGYHAVILEDGTVEWGRPEYWVGSHVRGYNRISLGVCLIGKGGDATQPQLSALRAVLELWKGRHPSAQVMGHCDLDENKDCPGFNVKEWWNGLAG